MIPDVLNTINRMGAYTHVGQ